MRGGEKLSIDERRNRTNQWSEGGNSYALINLAFLSKAGLVVVSASLISTVRCFLVKMKQSVLTIILILLTFTFACTQSKKPDIAQPANVNENTNLNYLQNKKPEIPESWKKIEECGFSFYAPSDLKELKVQPIDSCATDYRNKNILFSLDFVDGGGQESSSRRNEYSGEKDFQIAETIIDGRKAEIISYYQNSSDFKERKDLSFGAVLYVPVINERGDNLTIWTYNRSAEDREATETIFKTIRFGK